MPKPQRPSGLRSCAGRPGPAARRTSRSTLAARAALALSACACLAACELYPPERVRLRAPWLTEAWAASGFVSGWRLEGAAGPACIAPGDTAECVTGTGEALPVFLVAAVAGNGAPLRPLGSVWPHCLSDGVLVPTVPGGWTASVCGILLASDGRLASAVDWARLEREVAERLPDPWALDPAFAALRLAEGSFRVTDLEAPASLGVELDGLPGVLVDESPAGAPLEPDAEGRAFASLAPGTRRFLAPGYTLELSVRTDGSWTACASAP